MGMTSPPADPRPARRILPPLVALAAGVIWAAWFVNGSFAVTDKDNLRFYPPFRAKWDRNMNAHLGAENWEIAKAIYAGRGYADPFREPTGPTAWMSPA